VTEILNNFHIGIAAPIDTSYLRDYLVLDPAVDLPKGMGGSPSTALALELLRRGRKVSIFSLDPDIEAPQKFAGENLTIYFGKFRKRGRDRIKDGFRFEREFVAHAVREASPDIVNAHWTNVYALGSLSTNTPVLVTAHDAPLNIFKLNFNLFKFKLSVYWLIQLFMAFKVINRTIYMTTVSNYVAGHLKKCFFFKNKIKIIPNGIEDSRFSETDCDKKKPRESFVFISAANGWTKLKNEKILLHAFSVVNNKYPFTELWMFGKEHEPDGVIM
jgi:glycosyltransferase involved in cell wall biosynthesis